MQATIPKLMEMAESSSKWLENTVGKEEIAPYVHFLLFPLCFQKTCTADMSLPGHVWERLKMEIRLPHYDLYNFTTQQTFSTV